MSRLEDRIKASMRAQRRVKQEHSYFKAIVVLCLVGFALKWSGEVLSNPATWLIAGVYIAAKLYKWNRVRKNSQRNESDKNVKSA